jgi:hypothetical protein
MTLKLNFKITAYDYDKSGLVFVLINSKEYEYFIDAIFVPEILKLSKFRPGKALNLLKQKGKIINNEAALLQRGTERRKNET